jgi:hypothetical protein
MISGDLRVAPEAKSTRPDSRWSSHTTGCFVHAAWTCIDRPSSLFAAGRERTVDYGCEEQNQAQQWHPKITEVARCHGTAALHRQIYDHLSA